MPSEMQAFELSAVNKPDGPSPVLSKEHGVHHFNKEFHILIGLSTEQFSTDNDLLVHRREVFPIPCNDDRIMTVFNTVRSQGPKITGIQY